MGPPQLGGDPQGIMADSPYTEGTIRSLTQDEILTVGTDGIWEAQNEQGEFFGRERYLESIRRHQEKSCRDMCKAIVEDVHLFRGKHLQLDDITLIVIKPKSNSTDL